MSAGNSKDKLLPKIKSHTSHTLKKIFDRVDAAGRVLVCNLICPHSDHSLGRWLIPNETGIQHERTEQYQHEVRVHTHSGALQVCAG